MAEGIALLDIRAIRCCIEQFPDIKAFLHQVALIRAIPPYVVLGSLEYQLTPSVEYLEHLHVDISSPGHKDIIDQVIARRECRSHKQVAVF